MSVFDILQYLSMSFTIFWSQLPPSPLPVQVEAERWAKAASATDKQEAEKWAKAAAAKPSPATHTIWTLLKAGSYRDTATVSDNSDTSWRPGSV